MKFCDNPKCPNHVEVSYEIHRSTFATDVHGKRVEIKNHKFITPFGKTLFFCDWCKEAIDIYRWETNLGK